MSSVMDYDPINLSSSWNSSRESSSLHGPGVYDKWAIRIWLYTPNMSDEDRDLILALSFNRTSTMSFGTDGDAMASPGSNTDPRAKRYDLSE